MEFSDALERVGQSISSRQVFSEPIERDGTTVILAAKMGAGGGGGQGESPEVEGQAHPAGKGSGLGYGFGAKPLGAFVLREGKVRWRPAIDVNRVILGGQLVAATALIFLGGALRAAIARGRWRRHLFAF